MATPELGHRIYMYIYTYIYIYIHRHFNSDGHRGLEEMEIQLIDHVKGEKQLRERENQWIYKLVTLAPHGLNDNDGFYNQNKKSRASARGR